MIDLSLQVKTLTDKDVSRWDAFVNTNDQATFFHLSGWKKVIEESFGHRTYFLFIEKDREIQGILPLAHVKSVLFGNNLVSLPFCVYGGIVANSREAYQNLLDAACRLSNDLKVDSLELRNVDQKQEGWETKNLYVTFRKEIPSDSEDILKFIPNKQRAVVRKGIKAGLISDVDWDWKRIYRVYSESVRDLGTPVFSSKYFRILGETFGEQCRSLLVTHSGKDVAGVLSFYFKGQVLPYYAGSTEAARPLYAHGFMYWDLMRRAAEEGIRIFDFGRSKVDTGSYGFKKNWGFQPEPLFYDYYLVKAEKVPQVNPSNPRYQLFIDSWKKLPLSVANKLGPFLAKNLG